MDMLTNFLLVSLALNAFLLGLWFLTVVTNGFSRRGRRGATGTGRSNPREVLRRSLQLAQTRRVHMIMRKPNSVLDMVTNIWSRQPTGNEYLFFPKGYLLAGLSDYAIAKGDSEVMECVRKCYERFVVPAGKTAFNFDRVDQAVFGLVGLNLHRYYGADRYRALSDHIFEQLSALANESGGLIMYRRKIPIYFVDTLGMVCPFLSRYSRYLRNEAAVRLCRSQLEFYHSHGVDSATSIPAHGVLLKTMTKVGSANWGRGVGWYILGLSEYCRVTDDAAGWGWLKTHISVLRKLTIDGCLLTQFPGSSDDVDLSATIPFLYGWQTLEPAAIDLEGLFAVLGRWIRKGHVCATSGDTMGCNRYSSEFGRSELTQGLFLLLLSGGIGKNPAETPSVHSQEQRKQ